MPRKESHGRASGLPLALEMLVSDHRKVDELFEQFESMKEEDDASRIAIAQRVCAEITVHARVEEDLFYPWLRESLDDTDKVAEAGVEHATLKRLIEQIMPVGEPDEAYDAKVKVLAEYVKHHVKEEENEIFPEVSSEREELDELGQEMAARKGEIMAEMGLEDSDETLAASGAARKSKKPRAINPRQPR